MLFDAIRSFLVHAGFEKIIHCNSYDDAIQGLKSQPVSLIITDADENHSAANDLLHFVRIVKKQGTLPFTVISGASEVEAVRKILAFGYTEYLVKPFNELLSHKK